MKRKYYYMFAVIIVLIAMVIIPSLQKPTIPENPFPISEDSISSETSSVNSTSSSSQESPSSSIVRANVDTGPMSSDVSSVPPASSEVEYNYLDEAERATKLEEYLRKNLSPQDHGGILLLKSDIVTLDIWVVNSEKVNEVLKSYTGDKFQPILKSARCSYQAMDDLRKQLESIVINSDEKLIPFLSEMDNSVTVNIVSPDIELLTDKVQAIIDKAIKDNDFPSECVNIHVMYKHGENPVT